MTQPCTEKATLERIEGTLNEIRQRLYVDNGHECVQTSLTKGSARMAAIERDLAALKTRPRTILAIIASMSAIASAATTVVAWVFSHVTLRGTQ